MKYDCCGYIFDVRLAGAARWLSFFFPRIYRKARELDFFFFFVFLLNELNFVTIHFVAVSNVSLRGRPVSIRSRLFHSLWSRIENFVNPSQLVKITSAVRSLTNNSRRSDTCGGAPARARVTLLIGDGPVCRFHRESRIRRNLDPGACNALKKNIYIFIIIVKFNDSCFR